MMCYKALCSEKGDFDKRDFISHAVSSEVFNGTAGMEISSFKQRFL